MTQSASFPFQQFRFYETSEKIVLDFEENKKNSVKRVNRDVQPFFTCLDFFTSRLSQLIMTC